MKNGNLTRIFQRYINGRLTTDQSVELQSLLSDEDNKSAITELIDQTWDDMSQSQLPYVPEEIDRRVYANVMKRTDSNRKIKYLWLRSAAALLLIVICSIAYVLVKKSTTNQTSNMAGIKPGKSGATLTLADGSKIDLSSAEQGQVTTQGEVSIHKTNAGRLVYRVKRLNSIASGYNTLATANGQQFQVVLPDGTQVWLNAASSLTFPVSFSDKQKRRVKLKGEGYFEVTKDKLHPFVVESTSQTVEVLGTHFNINNYGDDIKTTLLEGRVKVASAVSQDMQIIRPGQQTILFKGAIKVVETTAAYAVAWKDGYFRFDGKTMETAMNEIARWYDVKVVFNSQDLKTRKLAGTVSKYTSIDQVLKKIELTGAFRFEVKNKQIIVQ